jgi:prophage antirepressor-like protein
MDLTKSEILKVKTKGTLNIIEDSPLHKAVMSAMEYYAEQEAKAFANWMSQQVNHDLKMSDFWKKFRKEVS